MPDQQKNPEISVIIPVYNAARFLDDCLTTLVHQTFRDFEIVAVNDGSLDDSLQILREYEAAYPFITVVDQHNTGMSGARNRGLAIARGNYFCFVDSDDYVAPRYLEELYRAVTENRADIACCYYYYHFVRSDVLYKYPFRCQGVFDKGEAMNKLLRDMQIQSLVWNKIFRADLFRSHNITFPPMTFEDVAIVNRLFAHAEKVVVIDKALYYYNQQSNSTIATINADRINDFIRATAMVRVSLENSGLYEEYEKAYQALARKTRYCCFYFVLKMHWRDRQMKHCLGNLFRVARALRYYSGKDFMPSMPLESQLPDMVTSPELKENCSVR